MSTATERPESASFDTIEGDIAALEHKKRMGDAFERVVLHYLRSAGTGLRQVWRWDDWPDRLELGLKADQGVDLVGTDGEGRRVAVQVKFHTDPERDVTQREVATLFSLRPDLFDRWVIVSNAIGHSPAAERATHGRGDVTWVHRADLAASPIDWAGATESVSGKARKEVARVSPRDPEQTAAIADVVKALKNGERAQLVMACGTGKTLVTRWITEARRDRLVLVLVPTLLLLKQFRSAWREQAEHDFIDLAVCSDADVVGKDEWTVHADELGARVTTDPSAIAAFLKGDGRRVVFGTYASSARIAEAQADGAVPAFDLVVADEAHRVAGISARSSDRERDQRVVLDADRIRAKRRLFATATPRVYGAAAKGRFADREDIEFASMDNPGVFGEEAHKLWFREAVELERLVDYRLSVVVVTDAEVERLVREREIVDVEGRTFDAETLASLVALRRAVDELGLTRAISFHSTIKRARDFARELERLELDAPPVSAHHISGAMSMADRQRVLRRLKEPEGPTVVTNARCLTEGIDVPSLDAVAFVDPRSSAVDIVQAVGRVMRTAPGKHLGHVIVPVFLTEEGLADPEAAIESSAFAPVLAVLRALRAHDPELVSDATRVATSLGGRDAVVGGHISEHIQVLGHALDVSRFEQALETRFVHVSADRWEVGMAHLLAYVAQTGSASPAGKYKAEDGYRLGQWVNGCRTAFKRGKLRKDRVAAFAAVKGWEWDVLKADWRILLGHIRHFRVENAGKPIPANLVVPDADGEDYQLGVKVTSLQGRFKDGDLTDRQVSELEAIDGWAWSRHGRRWTQNVALLRRYVEREGHSDVPRPWREDDVRLGEWVNNVRARKRAGSLADGRDRELMAIPGWAWEPRREGWHDRFDRLHEYANRVGDARVKQRHVEPDGYRLGSVVNSMRSDYKDGKLTQDEIAQLEALPGWSWDSFEDAFQEGMAHLRAYVRLKRHARPRLSYVSEDGYRLGQWVDGRRTDYNRRKLSAERIVALEALAGWTWDPRTDDWQEGLEHLRAYVAANGHARPPRPYVTQDGLRLGQWVTVQRSAHKRGKLAPERISELEALPGWAWAAR